MKKLIHLHASHIREFTHHLGVALDSSDRRGELRKAGVSVRVLRRIYDGVIRGTRDIEILNDKYAHVIAGIADDAGLEGLYNSIVGTTPPPSPKPPRIFKPENEETRFFKNTSRYTNAEVHEMIDFILEGGRLPPECKVVIVQSRHHYSSGRATFAHFRGGRVRKQLWGGRVFVRCPISSSKKVFRPARKGYLETTAYGADEEFFSILAHEVRHVFQRKGLARECRRIRRYNLGTRGKLTEVDASLFEIRTLRRWRRERPVKSPAVLPLP